MILLTAFFPTTPERAEELELCLKHNLALPFFRHVVLLCEKGARPSFSDPKLVCIDKLRRMVYGDFFGYANEHYPDGSICVVSNTDVMYDDTLKQFVYLPGSRWTNHLYAITRTNEDGKLQNCGSQDTWVFKTPLPRFDGWDLILGIIGCDSFLAQKAVMAKMTVSNPALSIRCAHRHRVAVRNDMLPIEGSDKKTCYWNAPGYMAFSIPYTELWPTSFSTNGTLATPCSSASTSSGSPRCSPKMSSCCTANRSSTSNWSRPLNTCPTSGCWT